ncbi:hypothetical protein [Brevibacterium permense]|uniref:hypothetical protein n=1 Tax=Brevibacterium permense TaxID=234834 RepID=UPI0021D2ED4B|nr:hypothetical protein [Brevibacterium permense]
MDDCENDGRHNVEGKFVCPKHRMRHDRATKNRCFVRGCDGVVRFGQKRDGPRFCRTHEQGYQTENVDELESSLDYIADNTAEVGELGCWQYRGTQPNGYVPSPDDDRTRTKLLSNGLNWLAHRFLYVYFFGGHRGDRELHHLCRVPACVRPGHLVPVTGAYNRWIESDDPDAVQQRELDRKRIKHDPERPDDPAKADELDRFAARIKRKGIKHNDT